MQNQPDHCISISMPLTLPESEQSNPKGKKGNSEMSQITHNIGGNGNSTMFISMMQEFDYSSGARNFEQGKWATTRYGIQTSTRQCSGRNIEMANGIGMFSERQKLTRSFISFAILTAQEPARFCPANATKLSMSSDPILTVISTMSPERLNSCVTMLTRSCLCDDKIEDMFNVHSRLLDQL
jgi:hypothetical protein